MDSAGNAYFLRETMAIIMKNLPSVEKCFLDEDIANKPECSALTALRGEEVHYMVAYTMTEAGEECAYTLSTACALPYTVETVEQVPVYRPCDPQHYDGDYLRTTPGLYPDLLTPAADGNRIFATSALLAALYVTVKVPENVPAGEYSVTVRLMKDGAAAAETVMPITVLAATLPKQTIAVTEWFYCDCLATYYRVPVWSEEHWALIGKYLQTAVDNGINTILTPIFTPPLNASVGVNGPTVQLIDVEKTVDGWKFGFARFERWVEVCRSAGVEYFEIAHLFTQWGAEHAPKIMATVGGVEEKVFGWETDSLSEEYITFLRAFLTAFTEKLRALGIADRCFFHISDEPGFQHMERYRAVKAAISDILTDYPIMDALSNFEFYQTGTVTNPIPSTDHIEPFLEAEVPGLWTYYCCGQAVDVSNRYVAMPSSRTRVIGMQLWKYKIAGFLQWGYNFWYEIFSLRPINPYLVTDGGMYVQAGDCYAVYPGEDGTPRTSLHMKAFTEALTDLRAMRLAESLVGREAVLSAMEEGLDAPVTFSQYPHDPAYVTKVRDRVNALIASAL